MKTVLKPPSAILRTRRYLSSMRISCKRANLVSRQSVIRHDNIWGGGGVNDGPSFRASGRCEFKCQRKNVSSALKPLLKLFFLPDFGQLCFPTIGFCFFFKDYSPEACLSTTIYIQKFNFIFTKKSLSVTNG